MTTPAPAQPTAFDKARASDAEVALIGAALVDATPVVAYARKWGIGADSFIAEPRNSILWAAICELEDEAPRCPGQSNVDPITLMDHLRARGLFEKVGGSAYLSVIIDKTPSSAHAAHYVQIVHDLHMRAKVLLATDQVRRMATDPDLTPHDVVSNAVNTFALLLHRPDTKTTHEIIDQVIETWTDISQANQQGKPRHYQGIPTGFDNLDDILSGNQPGMNLLAGLPGDGKTSFACHTLLNIASTGTPCAAVMMDITTRRTLGRMIANRAGISLAKINKGNAHGQDWAKILDAAEVIKLLPIHFLENEDDYASVASFLRVVSQDKGVRYFIGDYIQLIDHYDYRREPENIQIKHTVRGFKKLSYATGLSGLWLAQFNRDSVKNDRPPRMSDLHGASALEKEATTCTLLYQWAKYPYPKNNDGTPDHTHPHSNKQRRAVAVEICKQQDGETAVFPYWFYAPTFKFESAPERWGLTASEYQNIVNPPKPDKKGGY